MGFLDKVKNIFTEVDEEEKEPIKKEVFQVEIPAPKIEEKKTSTPIEKEPIKVEEKEEKFVFPMFDDSDFVEEPVKKEEPKIAPRRSEYVSRQNVVKEEPRKRFKLSPVISPVYGILDKNYKKEDIIEKKDQEETYTYRESTAIKVDRVRKKAFGTLEDEVESGLDDIKIGEVATNEIKVDNKETDDLKNMFFDDDMTLEDAIKNYEEKEALKEKDDDLIESDLFNLIDSMYDKESKEEE